MSASDWLGLGASVATILVALPVVARLLLTPLVKGIMETLSDDIKKALNAHLKRVERKIGEKFDEHIREYHHDDR